MGPTPLQNLLGIASLSADVRIAIEAFVLLCAALTAIALRRRRLMVSGGTFSLLAFGLSLDVVLHLLLWLSGHSFTLAPWMAGFAVIFFLWGVIQLLLQILLRPRGRPHYSTIGRDVLMILAWALVVAVVLNVTLGVDITKIFVSSAVVLGAIGLALQSSLSNIFAGVMLQIARPFQPGDWVRLENHVGVVKGISWAATEIVTRANERIEIPNAALANQTMVNYAGGGAIADEISISISYQDPPGRVKEAILKVVRDVPHVLADPPPQIYAWEYGDYAIKYRIKYWLADYAVQEAVRDTLVSSLWYALRRHQIDIPYPTQTLEMRRRQPRRAADARFEQEIMTDLRRVDWLRGLTDDELRALLPTINVHDYGVGEVLVREGDPGDSFFIIRRGTVEVIAKSRGGAVRHIADTTADSPHPFFGEASLMAGEPRNATIRARTDVEVLEMNREGFSRLFKQHPELAEPMVEIIAARGRERTELLTDAQQGDGTRGRRRWLMAKMRELFDF